MPSLTPELLRAVRRQIRSELPGVQASHVAEALAYALGFNTSIALQTSLANGPVDTEASAERFVERMLQISPQSNEDAAGHAFRTAWTSSMPQSVGDVTYFTSIWRDMRGMPPLSPREWLRNNKIALREGEFDVKAAESAFRQQLGPRWEGVEQAPYQVQAVCILAMLNFQRDKEAGSLCERLDEIHVLQPGKAAQATRELLDKHLKNKSLAAAINRRGEGHAYMNTAAISVYGTGGAPSMFRWLKAVDRTLWYCLSNVGRRSFHVEGVGATSHFLAERVLRQPLVDPCLDSALDGLESYIEANGMLANGPVDAEVSAERHADRMTCPFPEVDRDAAWRALSDAWPATTGGQDRGDLGMLGCSPGRILQMHALHDVQGRLRVMQQTGAGEIPLTENGEISTVEEFFNLPGGWHQCEVNVAEQDPVKQAEFSKLVISLRRLDDDQPNASTKSKS